MKSIKLTFKNTTYYAGSNILVQICGIISLPVWTRVLTVDEYGLFSLIVVTIALLSSGSKFGLQHAALRYYSKFKKDSRKDGLSIYYSTIILSSIIFSIVICSFFLLFFERMEGINKSGLPMIVFIVAMLGLINSVSSIQMNVLRALQRAKQISVIAVIKRYSKFILPLIIVVYLWGFKLLFTGWIITDLVILIYLFIVLNKIFNLKLKLFSLEFLKEALYYGVPLMGFELSTTILSIGDRYLIKWFMGDSAVGMYSAGYNLASYGSEIITAPLKMAVIPMFLSIWERTGQKDTQEFLDNIFVYYVLIAIPLMAGMIYLREDIITVLLSEKYIDSKQIIPFVVFPLICYGAFFIYGAGYFIKKRSMSIAGFTGFAALLNIILNYFLIPRYGLEGAAFSTCISYLILSWLVYYFAGKLIKVKLPIIPILKYVLISFVMLYVISFIDAHGLVALLEKILLGFVVYSLGVLIIDDNLRKTALSNLNRLRNS